MAPRAGAAAAGGPAGPGLRIEPVRGRSGLEAFIALPERLYAGRRGYVAPLRLERRQALSPRSNPYFEHATAQFWVAWRGGRPVGRISAQVDRLHLAQHRDDTGHFGFLDAEDDADLFRALTATAESWLRAQGMRRILGPLNLSINEEIGLLVDGFEERPMMMMGFSPPYAGPRLEAQGYVKAKDVLAYDYNIARDVSERTRQRMRRARRDPGIEVRTLDMARFHDELALAIDIFNDAWSQNWGFVPFTRAEIEAVAKAMRPLVRPELVAFASVGGEPAAMLVALPNLNDAIADLNGRLLPFGWARLLWRLKVGRPQSVRVLLMGVRRKHHGGPIGSALMLAMFDSFYEGMRRLGIDHAELSWILEDNRPMRAVLGGLGARVYKTYRIYEKALEPGPGGPP
ncbi:MAG: hypothetical protein IRY94_03325 [Rhodospirillaceae bacterium]|nr:hypothetical protein [Rhodospirillaceae bacterium]